MRTVTVALLVLMGAIGGCLADSGEGEVAASADDDAGDALPGDDGNATATPALAEADVPEWQVGDAWSITTHGGEGSAMYALVVVDAGSSGYTIAATDEEITVLDAIHDISYLGRIRTSDLAGSQQDAPVRFFDFPLTDGKTWTTTWDGFEVKLTATLADAIPTPDGPKPGFRIVGTHEDATYVTYDYVPDVGWWTGISFEAGYGFTVNRVIHNATGTYPVATAELLFEATSEAPFGMHGTGSFTVAEGQTSLLLMVDGHAEHVARTVVLTDPAGTPVIAQEPTTDQPPGVWSPRHLPTTPGEWHIAAPALHDPEGSVRVQVQQVVVEERVIPAA